MPGGGDAHARPRKGVRRGGAPVGWPAAEAVVVAGGVGRAAQAHSGRGCTRGQGRVGQTAHAGVKSPLQAYKGGASVAGIVVMLVAAG